MVSKQISILIGVVLGALLLVVGGYVAYLALSYYRIGDVNLDVEGEATYSTVQTGTTYSVATYNLGFGAYQQDYSCLTDMCYVQDSASGWVKTTGDNLKALSLSDVKTNTEGAARTLNSLSADFVFTQETDTYSDRSHGVNQKNWLQNAFEGYASDFAINNHTPFIAYPFEDMEGFANSGILTLSRYAIRSADRHELATSEDFLSKLYDLDRCFSVSYVEVDNGAQLVLVNVHMSANDAGSAIRSQQRQQLYSFISEEYAKGNYVVVGGDFNHDLLTNNPDYPEYTKDEPAFSALYSEKPMTRIAWYSDSGDSGMPDGFTLTASDNWPSTRNAGVVWQPGFNQIYTLDGFITSNNVRIVSHENVETDTVVADGFAYSDHEPAYLEFVLE